MNKLLLAIVTIACACGGGGLSQEEINAEFERYVAERNQCTMDDDCALVSATCPLPCFVAVTRGQEADVRAKAEALMDEYDGVRCAYRCAPARAMCSEGRCATARP